MVSGCLWAEGDKSGSAQTRAPKHICCRVGPWNLIATGGRAVPIRMPLGRSVARPVHCGPAGTCSRLVRSRRARAGVRTVKCPRCLAVCLEDDPFCPSCRTPFGGSPDGQAVVVANRPHRGTRLALVSLAVGGGLGPLVGPLTGRVIVRVPSPPPALDLNILLWGLLGAALGLAIGYGLGAALYRSK